MGNSQSQAEASAHSRRDRSGTRDNLPESPNTPGNLRKRASLKRLGHTASATTLHEGPITRKGSVDTASTVDHVGDRLELLDEPGSSLPQDDVPRRIGIVDDAEQLEEDDSNNEADAHDGDRVAISIRWTGKAEKVYVTGSFSSWRKKIQLLPNDTRTEFSLVLNLKPGTHRLKFDVDGVWKLSDDLAVATDSSGNFVNYVDVAEEDLSLTRDNAGNQADVNDNNRAEEVDATQRWTSKIPSFIQRAADPDSNDADVETLVPPTLPPHLEKVILNTSNERKDDHSVLPQPNHVMLNHLAASSIRNGVLAVSASTRYRRKYVTTILYRPAVA